MSGKEQWEAETVAKALTKGPERRTVFETTSGIPVERLYTPEYQRPIEPEAVFGQMKADMHYKRFRHFGMDKVYMDLGLFGMGFNLKKYLGIKR